MVQKICAFNDDEIDGRCQFHQYFMSIFLYEVVLQSFSIITLVGFIILWQKNIGSKASRKMLVKLTTGAGIPQLAAGTKLRTGSRSGTQLRIV